jgi:site-specific DNA recombinase
MSARNRSDLLTSFDKVVSCRSRLQRTDWGLPNEEARLALARTYLEMQSQLWPELLERGLFLPLSEEAIATYAEMLKASFVDGTIEPFVPNKNFKLLIGSAYVRYSCDNSNSRSLAQQLRNILEAAKRLEYYIPWQYVLADAAVSGTTTDRRGYQLAKELIRVQAFGCDCLMVDEIGRANRDTIESLMLGRLVNHFRKRMVGVTDGFDSRLPQSLFQLTMFAAMHEFFVHQLREKVYRGMNDAFRLGRNIRPACLGYKIIPIRNEDGTYVFKPNGKPLTRRVIDTKGAKYVLTGFRLYVERRWSTTRIARYFNSRRVGNSRSWDSSGIINMLRRETYIGIEYYGMTRKQLHPETGETTYVNIPRDQWRRREVPDMRIVPDDLWMKTQQRLKECSEAFAARKTDGQEAGVTHLSRMQAYPRLLFRPRCGCCKRELHFGQSGKYPTLCCPNGSRRKNGCKLHSYKSIRLIDKAMTEYLLKQVCTEEFLKEVVDQANNYLETERSRPRKQVKKEPDGLKRMIAQRDRLAGIIEEQDASDIASLVKRLRTLEKQIEETKRDHQQEVAADTPVPSPIDFPEVAKMMADLNSLLREDVTKVAPVMREMFGDIEVEELKDTGSKRPVWLAKFSMNSVPVMLLLANAGKLPNKESWEYLTLRSWKFSKPCTVSVKEMPIYEEIAPKVMALKSQGLSDEVVSRKTGETVSNVRYARLFAERGERPKSGPTRKRTGTGVKSYYKEIAEQVVYLRDIKKMHFDDIATHLEKSEATIRRAYDSKKPLAIEAGKRPRRGASERLSPEIHREIEELIRYGCFSASEIARACKCGLNTVLRKRKQMGQIQTEALPQGQASSEL